MPSNKNGYDGFMFSVLTQIRKTSLGFKVSLLVGTVSFLALVVTGALVLYQSYQVSRKNFENEISAVSSVVGIHSTSALLFSDKSAAQETLNALAATKQVVFGVILDLKGETFSIFPADTILSNRINVNGISEPFFSQNGNRLRYHFPIMFEKSSVGILVVESDLGKLHSHLKQEAFKTAGLLIVIFCIVIILALRLQRIVVQPVLELANVMKQVTENRDYSLRADAHTDDEVGLLVRVFNEMLTEMQHHKADLYHQAIELAKARDRALEAARIKSEFLANMSHEIRTPLNGIVGMTSILEKLNLNKDQADCLLTIKLCANALLGVVNNVLDFSKIEAGKLELSPVSFDIRKHLKDLETMFHQRMHEKNLSFILSIDPLAPLKVTGDRERILQVIVNLFSNAIKFTPDHGAIVLKVAALEKTNNKTLLRFSVSDTGIGIPDDKKQIIFDAFTQADASMTRKYGGTGLGLSISIKLVEMMGGKLEFSSKVGCGSVFRFSLWFDIDEDIEHKQKLDWQAEDATKERVVSVNQELKQEVIQSYANKAESTTLSNSTQSDTGQESLPHLDILVVEDNIVNQKVAKRLLNKLGHTVVIAKNGIEAVEYVKNKNFNLIFMDCQMPDMDGFEATAILRQKEELSGQHIPIVALTAHAMEGDRERCLNAGMDDYISKPVTLSCLQDMLKKHMQSILTED